MTNILEVNNVTFSYGNEPIFNKIGFSVYKGDFVAVIGPNGAGKSTLLRLMLGELPPASGSIRLFGQDIHRFKNWPRIGYVPQAGLQSSVNFPATVEEIVKVNLFSRIGLLRFPKREHREKTLQTLEAVEMGAYSRRMIGELSGGQQQRVLLARVLVNEPEIMLLDEPTTGVDTQSVQSLYELLRQLNRKTGLTIVMVTHDIVRAVNYVSKVFCLEDGSLVELDKAQIDEELSHKHMHPLKNSQKQEEGEDSHNGDF